MSISKNEFKEMIEKLNAEEKIIVTNLVDELIFIVKTLDSLKKKIEKDGPVIEKQTGNGYKTVCENPALKGYNTTIKSFNTTVKSLSKYIPETPEIDEFMEFCFGKER